MVRLQKFKHVPCSLLRNVPLSFYNQGSRIFTKFFNQDTRSWLHAIDATSYKNVETTT